MADFWVTHEESAYLDFILAEDLEQGSQDATFVEELREAIHRRDTIRFEPPFEGAPVMAINGGLPPRGAEILVFSGCNPAGVC